MNLFFGHSLQIKKVIPVIGLLVAGITFFSCKYDHADNKPCNTTVPDTVSFSRDLLPLFHIYCSTPGCHSAINPQGHLDMSDGVAYLQLKRAGSGYIDTINPGLSILYSQLNSTSRPMPPAEKWDACKIEMVLRWIQQGALNN